MKIPALFRVVPVAGLAGLLVAAAEPAAAQIGGGVDCALASQNNFPAPDQRRIQDHVDGAAREMLDPDRDTSLAGRDELVRPLDCAGITVAFRQAYGRALSAPVGGLVGHADARIATNALQIMGKARSTESVRAVADGLADQREVVRYAATTGFRELLSKPAAQPWPFAQRQVDQSLELLKATIERDASVNVVLGAVEALVSVDDPNDRPGAMQRVAEGLSQRRAFLDPGALSDEELGAWARIMLRAANECRNAVFNIQPGANDAFMRSAGILGGNCLALARDVLDARGNDLDSTIAGELATVVNVSEALVVFTGSQLGAAVPAPNPNLQTVFGRADSGAFEGAVDGWIGQGGLLTRAPFSAPAGEFDAGQ